MFFTKRSHGGRTSPHDAAGMPLDVAREAFRLLTTGPAPVSIDGRLFDGLPKRRVVLDEVRDRLLARDCPQATRDAVWAHLVLLSRTHGDAWTVGCVGVALPALTRAAAILSSRFAADPADIHAEVLSGFLAALARVDLARPRIMLRLRWAAYRAGHAAVREALDAPTPMGDVFHSAEPPAPFGHPDLVLVRAVADGVITTREANLIGATRLEKIPLRRYAGERRASYEAYKKTRQRAERRLAAYLRDDLQSETATDARSERSAAVHRVERRGHGNRPGRRQLAEEPRRPRGRVPVAPRRRSSGVRTTPQPSTPEAPRCA